MALTAEQRQMYIAHMTANELFALDVILALARAGAFDQDDINSRAQIIGQAFDLLKAQGVGSGTPC